MRLRAPRMVEWFISCASDDRAPSSAPKRPMPNRHERPRLRRQPSVPASWRALGIAFVLVAITLEPAAAVATASRTRTTSLPGAALTPPVVEPAPTTAVAVDDFPVAISQSALSFDSATNRAMVTVTTIAPGAQVPWTWTVAVRGRVVASGSSSATSVTTTVMNDCRITSMSVTSQITDSLGRTADAATTLSSSLCPPPLARRYDRDRILAQPTLSKASFVDRLRAADSPALAAGPAIYRRLLRAGVNPAFALGMFHAESHSGTAGYAVTTRNWGNILFYPWTREYGATPYAPGNGYTYARFPTWRASVRALCALFKRYWHDGYRNVGTTSAHWLGARPAASDTCAT